MNERIRQHHQVCSLSLDERIHLAAVDSTNSEARRRLADGHPLPGLTLIDTDCQTAGRGQQGNSWESEAGMNLAFSLVCHPTFVAPARQFVLSQAIALAVAEAICDLVGVHCQVKWPNDIYIGDRKVSGTLIECDLQGGHILNCIIGTGINVNQTVFRSDAPNPVSLKQLAGHDFDREALICLVVDHFLQLYALLQQGESAEVHHRYMQRLYRREGIHPFADANGAFMACIAAVEPTGHLRLQLPDGSLRRYEFKEVKFLIDLF